MSVRLSERQHTTTLPTHNFWRVCVIVIVEGIPKSIKHGSLLVMNMKEMVIKASLVFIILV